MKRQKDKQEFRKKEVSPEIIEDDSDGIENEVNKNEENTRKEVPNKLKEKSTDSTSKVQKWIVFSPFEINDDGKKGRSGGKRERSPTVETAGWLCFKL